MQDRKPQDQDKFVLRLPDGMRARIKAEAEANNRSMNSEILARLEQSFEYLEGGATLSIKIDLAQVDQGDLKQKLEAISDHLRTLNPMIRPLQTKVEE